MTKYIAHMIPEYLGHTLNWVYTQIKHVRTYTPYVMTRKTMNLEDYPLEFIYTSQRQGDAPYWLRWGEGVVRRLGYLPPKDYICYSRVLHQFPPELIHAHFGWDGFFALGLKKRHRIPLVTRFYGYDIGILPRNPLWKRRYSRLFLDGDLFIVEGANMKQSLLDLGCMEEKIAVHHLGVELDKIPYKQRINQLGELKILIAGTFKEKKGIRYALQALAGVKDRLQNIDLKVTIIGDGELHADLHSLAEQCRLDKIITWTGYQPHHVFIQKLYEADMFLSPSVTAVNGDTEGGAPVSIIEAGQSHEALSY